MDYGILLFLRTASLFQITYVVRRKVMFSVMCAGGGDGPPMAMNCWPPQTKNCWSTPPAPWTITCWPILLPPARKTGDLLLPALHQKDKTGKTSGRTSLEGRPPPPLLPLGYVWFCMIGKSRMMRRPWSVMLMGGCLVSKRLNQNLTFAPPVLWLFPEGLARKFKEITLYCATF